MSVLILSLLMVAGALFAAPSALAQQRASPTSETAGQQQQQEIVTIIKDGTNSYLISGGSSSIGTFDTSYRIVGDRSVVRASQELIITTITEDFGRSPTIGYIMAAGTAPTDTGGTAQDNTTTTRTGATLPNPFATLEQVTERITNELRRAIGSAENNTPLDQLVEIKCDFGMALDDMSCLPAPSVGETGGTGGGGTTRPPPTNNTGGGGNNTEPLTVQAIIDIDQDATSAVVFEASIDGGSSPYTCEWDLGDNTTSDACNISYIYENPGTYSATINVTDAAGQTASDTTGPFTITNTTGGGGNNTEPLTVQAQIADIDQVETSLVLFETLIDGGTSPYTCEWNLGDGTSSDACNVSHIYANLGTYTATVTVTDAAGQTASDTTGPFTITNTTGGETTTPPPTTNATTTGGGGEQETTTPPPTTNATTTGGETTTPETTTPPPTTGEEEESTTTPPPETTTPNNEDLPLSGPDEDRPAPAATTTGERQESTTSQAEPLDTFGQ